MNCLIQMQNQPSGHQTVLQLARKLSLNRISYETSMTNHCLGQLFTEMAQCIEVTQLQQSVGNIRFRMV